MKKIETILTSLGYRKTKKGVWAKTIGYSFFIVNLETKEVSQWMKGVDGKIILFSGEIFDIFTSTFKDKIKSFECGYHCTYNPSEFEFLTIEEQVNCIL